MRPYTVLDCEQGSEAWATSRLGRITSSAADCVISMADLRGEKGKDNERTREGYALRLASERVTGLVSDESFTSGAMERGSALEPRALLRYMEAHPDHDVQRVGFVAGDDGTWGDSPDAWVYGPLGSPIGVCEFKCPNALTHMEYLDLGDVVPNDYLRQCVHHLWSAPTLEWCSFATFHPSLPAGFEWHEVRLTRTAAQPLLDRYDAAVLRLLQRVDALEARFRAGRVPAAKETT